MFEAKSKITKQILIFGVLLTVVFCAARISFAQNNSDIFNKIPEAQRGILQARLNEFVEYHRSKQWNKVYDMLVQQDKKTEKGVLTKEDFLKKKSYSSAKKFNPKSILELPFGDGGWMIYGCATFRTGGKSGASLSAYFENGNWYFTDIWAVFRCVDCEPISCKKL